jgi:hypothetical protein
VLRDLLADAPSSPDCWADGRSIVTDLAEAGRRFTGYRVAGRLVLEIECECASAAEPAEVCHAAGYGA